MKAILYSPGSLVAILLFIGVLFFGSATLNSAGFPQIVQSAFGVGAIIVAVVVLARRAITQMRGDKL